MTAQSRIAKQRTLQRAGFVHISGWVPAEYAEVIATMIAASADAVEQALTKLSQRGNFSK